MIKRLTILILTSVSIASCASTDGYVRPFDEKGSLTDNVATVEETSERARQAVIAALVSDGFTISQALSDVVTASRTIRDRKDEEIAYHVQVTAVVLPAGDNQTQVSLSANQRTTRHKKKHSNIQSESTVHDVKFYENFFSRLDAAIKRLPPVTVTAPAATAAATAPKIAENPPIESTDLQSIDHRKPMVKADMKGNESGAVIEPELIGLDESARTSAQGVVQPPSIKAPNKTAGGAIKNILGAGSEILESAAGIASGVAPAAAAALVAAPAAQAAVTAAGTKAAVDAATSLPSAAGVVTPADKSLQAVVPAAAADVVPLTGQTTVAAPIAASAAASALAPASSNLVTNSELATPGSLSNLEGKSGGAAGSVDTTADAVEPENLSRAGVGTTDDVNQLIQGMDPEALEMLRALINKVSPSLEDTAIGAIGSAAATAGLEAGAEKVKALVSPEESSVELPQPETGMKTDTETVAETEPTVKADAEHSSGAIETLDLPESNATASDQIKQDL